MHKITASFLAAWAALHTAAANVSVGVRSFLVELHIANLKAMVKRANDRVTRLRRLRSYHEAAASSVNRLVYKAADAAVAVEDAAQEEAAKHGVTLEV